MRNKLEDLLREAVDMVTVNSDYPEAVNYLLNNGIKVPYFSLGQKIWVLSQVFKDDHTEICEGEIIEISYKTTETPEDSKEWIRYRFTHPRYGSVIHENRVDNVLNKVVFTTFQDAKDYLVTHREADAWMYDKQGNLIRDYLDKAQVVGMYEDKLKMPYKERVTRWFVSMYEIKNGITKEKFLSMYEKAK